MEVKTIVKTPPFDIPAEELTERAVKGRGQ